VSAPEPSSRAGAAGVGPARAVFVVFLPFAAGFFFSDLYRQINAVIAPNLIEEIGLSAAGLGLLTSVFFLSFTANQLPLGVMLDRFGPRRVQAAQLLIAALGAAVFSFGQSEATLLAGRALIGLGVSGGLMSSLKAITLWFPRERWPLMNGLVLAFGGMGAMAATAPVEALLDVVGWRGVFLGAAALTAAAAMLIFFVVPEKPMPAAPLSFRRQINDLRRIFGDREFWRYTPVCVTGVAAAMSVQGLWAGPWMTDVAGLSQERLAVYLLANTGSMVLGFVLGGLATSALGRVGIGLPKVLGASIVLFMAAQVLIITEAAPSAVWPWIIFGLFGHMTVLSYAHLSHYFPLEFAGRANTSLNLAVFAGVFVVQYGMGLIINAYPLEAQGGYAAEGYRTAFIAALGLEAVAFAWFLIPGKPRSRENDSQA
jgi:predicted MFS family arabinose efflux permease